jgi:hypothetical protein
MDDTSNWTIHQPERSEWRCHLFGNPPSGSGIVWQPLKGEHPNWFWRKMQWLLLGNRWVKDAAGAHKETTDGR